jgi:hypothetical protein
MAEVKVGEKTIKVRALLRKEVKALKKQGVILHDLNSAAADEVMDPVFALVLSPGDIAMLEELPQHASFKTLVAILNETFGSADAEKN